jgi:DNA end-binding protein Ku
VDGPQPRAPRLIRPGRCGLVLHTLYYHDECGPENSAPRHRDRGPGTGAGPAAGGTLAAGFEPFKYRDRYRENLQALIEAKIHGQAVGEGVAEPALAPVVDLMEALQASLARAKKPVAVASAVATLPASEVAVSSGKRRKRA